jgi:Tfp pilus assembly protein PilP
MAIRIVTMAFAAALAAAPVAAQARQGGSPAPRPKAAAATPAATAAPADAAATPDAKPVLPPLEPAGYTYDPDSRRDPFVSLLRRGANSERETVGARAPGLQGLAASEISLTGIITSGSGYVGVVRGVDNKTYIVHAGDKLADGTVRSIGPDSMVILQQVNDPLSPQKQREVRKGLRQTEEAR